ncbi:MAG: IMP dehydrogenase [Pelagibacteraceae bacterium]|jgi:IMP dehydrogenase|nr:IMP dehydrogenase [Pelagibacteraceae bacterium]|tara:strand:+ start:103 stop:1167 length:1065 start_codon:yes stop_codon:yes gene_type:complete
MGNIKDSFTFDDVTLVPKYSSILPSEAVTSTRISHNLNLQIPLMSSAMDTVTESKMAVALSKSGGIGVIHRNLSIQKQVHEVKKVKKNNFLVGAAIGVNPKDIERVYKLLEAKVNLIVIDTAHGHTQKVLSMIKKIKKKFKKSTLCAGNIATGKAAKFLADAGVDIVKVGIGPGSICTTRLVTGIGVPQLSAILEVKKALKNYKTSIISDGGIKFSGDTAKAIAAGADAVMIGSLFSGTIESPGKTFKYKGKLYKNFRGMGSVGAMSIGSADRYYQEKFKNTSKYVPEGVEGIVKFKGSVNKIIYNLIGGLKSSMGYLGTKTIKDLQKKGEFIKISKAGFYESMVHNVDHVKKQ